MEAMHMEYDVAGDNFVSAGSASESIKNQLKQLGILPEDIRRVAIAVYEGEINMVIHAGGGKTVVDIYGDRIEVRLIDHGNGIKDVELAMQPGYSTATDKIRTLGFGAGMGLPNMKKYSDVMEIETEVGVGTTITLKIFFSI